MGVVAQWVGEDGETRGSKVVSVDISSQDKRVGLIVEYNVIDKY